MPFISSARKQYGPQGRKNTRWRAFPFSSHTFTSGGVNGPTGPGLGTLQSAYSSQPWASNTSYFNMSTNGIQEFLIPTTGFYRLTVVGASGGGNQYNGGRGAIITADLNLTANQFIKILVGQGGVSHWSNGTCDAGGGGGTFVTTSANSPLIIAGGGGGACDTTGYDALLTTSGGNASNGTSGGSGGSGGNSSHAQSGAGFTGNGQSAQWGNLGFSPDYAFSFTNGGQGGRSNQSSTRNIHGGFGGGGAAHGSCCIGSGGGGGYSGGGAGPSCGRSGGGGSFIVSSAVNVATSNGTYNGSSSFNGQTITNLGSWNTPVNYIPNFATNGYVTITKL